MAAKIGILGESTTTSGGTVTVYTVPADKAARVRAHFVVENNSSGSEYSIMMGTPGSELTGMREPNAGIDTFSGIIAEAAPDPATGLVLSAIGWQMQSGVVDLSNVDGHLNWWSAPLPVDYFLSTGDTVRFNISETSVTEHLFQCQGVEDDA